jgi:GAF domain-containing protein
MDNKNGLTRTAIRTGKLKVIKDTHKIIDINPNLVKEFRSMIVVPMKVRNQVIGVFYLHNKVRHDFTEMETTILLTLADQSAVVIQKAKLLNGL